MNHIFMPFAFVSSDAESLERRLQVDQVARDCPLKQACEPHPYCCPHCQARRLTCASPCVNTSAASLHGASRALALS